MPRCSQRVAPLTGDRQGIPTNTPDHFPTQAEDLGGPYGTRGTPALYGAIWASNLTADHLKPEPSPPATPRAGWLCTTEAGPGAYAHVHVRLV